MLPNGGYKTQASSDFQLLSVATTTTTNHKGGVRKMRAVVLLGVILLIPFCRCQERYSERTLPPEERNALRKINEKLNIGWNLTVNPCITNHRSWFRKQSNNDDKWEVDRTIERNISCYCNNNTNVCHVTQIYLMGQNLTGTLPEEFGNLTSLEILYLSRNYNISGTIPAAAWASAPLKIIMLIGNRLTGMIPEEIGRIATLQELILENNLLYGPIPEGLGKLTGLKRLLLSSNNFVGELPESLGNLKNLTDLRMDGNGISGSIPYFIGNLTNLTRLDMQGTSMKGAFPLSLSELKKLEELRVSDFSGDGKFPHLEHAASMTTLILRNCSISEKLPVNISLMKNLKTLDLSFNNIFGEIPADYRHLERHIENMFLNNNMITGLLPEWIATIAKFLDVSYNNFTGSAIPLGRDTTKNFVASFSSQDDRIDSYFKRNLPCPGSPENYEIYINCGGSKVKIGKIEYEDDLTKAGQSTFHVSESKRWAYSSTGVFTNGASQYIISNETTLSMTDSDLYSSARLSASSLSYYGLCLQKGNYRVNLSFAEIIFTNDNTFASQGRRIFDVLIQGQLKKKDFNIAEAANGTGRSTILTFDVDVEDSTLEINLRWAGKGTNAIPWRGVYGPLISAISVTPNFKPWQRENKRLSLGVISAISFASATMILLIVIFLSLYVRRRRTKNKELEMLDLLTGCYSLEEIKLATDGFSSRNKIGEGGFGAVYKGVLPSGTAIAVKQLSSRSCQGNHEFVNEIGIVSALQHPNLVKLLGCCIEGNQLLLIYEYMKNNCLARALFGPENMKYKLDWKTRCKICLGMAKGLAYLHEESRLKIVHRDIKPSNILLDENLNAKISDFGLAKLYEDGKSQSSTRIAGTVGYMAPEYTTRGHLTYKADVYSFGVVMLEILSGKSNANYWADEGFEYLLDWADALKKDDRLLELVDPILGSNYPIEEAQQFLTVSLACTNKSPRLRPKMSDVVMILQHVMHVETSYIVHSNILMFSEEPEPRELCLKLSRGKKNSISPTTDDL